MTIKTLTIALTVLAVLFAPQYSRAPDGLEQDYVQTLEVLTRARELLEKSGGGDTEAMRELASLFASSSWIPGQWYRRAAVMGNDQAVTDAIWFRLRDDKKKTNYMGAYYWMMAASRAGIISPEPKFGSYGYGGTKIYTPEWLTSQLTPEQMQRAKRYENSLYRRLMKTRTPPRAK